MEQTIYKPPILDACCRETTFKGAFNIYQAKSGAIMLLMGAKHTALTYSQINDLNINCYELSEFNHDDYEHYYLKSSVNL